MNNFRIALMGDSMLERWGAQCPQLHAALRRQYPRSEFALYNHGLAGSRAGNGLWRLTHRYHLDLEAHDGADVVRDKKDKDATANHAAMYAGDAWRESLSWCDPSLVVVESFAYTHRIDGAEGLSEYRDVLRRLVEQIQHSTGAKFLFCVTMAPLREHFLDNAAAYINTSRATRQRFADDVSLYLDEARRIAQDEGWPVADVAAEVRKRIAAGEHPLRFVDHNDFQHLSPYGLQVQASAIVRAIDNGRMIEEVAQH